jgi:hypothetical protein
LLVLGLGALVWDLALSNPVNSAISAIEDLSPTAPGPQDGSGGGLPQGTSPDGNPPGGAAPQQPAIPLPQPLAELGARLGITDVGQLIDLAVANGLLSEQDAEALRRALTAGSGQAPQAPQAPQQ